VQQSFPCLSAVAGLFVAAFDDEHLQVVMEDEGWDLQVQAVMEDGEKVLQVGMEDAEAQMESGSCSGQFGCRKEEGRSEMEERDRSKMEEWMDGMDE